MTSEQRRMKLNEVARRGVSVPVSAHPDLERAVPGRDTWAWSWWSYVWPRPTAAAWTDRPDTLPAAQEAWDRSRAFVAARLEREQERAQATEAAQAAEDARRQEREAIAAEDLKASIRADFFAGNPTASDADFERNYQAMKDDQMRRQADQARHDTRRLIERALL